MLDEALGVTSTQAQTVALNCNKLGMDSFDAGQPESALFYLKKGYRVAEADVHCLKLKAVSCNNLACVYNALQRPKKALQYLLKALDCEYQLSDLACAAATHLNLSAVSSGSDAPSDWIP